MSIFNTESKLYKGLTWFSNIVVLNIYWILFSLPIVTIGASTVAAYSMIFKIMDNKEGYLFKGFVKEFKANWKQGTLLWIVTLIAGYAAYLDAQILIKGDPGIPVIVASILTFVIVLCAILLAFPLCARYENKFYNYLRFSFLLCIRYFGHTLFMIVVLAAEIALFFWNTTTLILIVLIGPIVFITTVAGTARKIFADNERRLAEDGVDKENTTAIEEQTSEDNNL